VILEHASCTHLCIVRLHQSSGMAASRETIRYSDASNLNTLDIVAVPDLPGSKGQRQFWIVYIHGGAWCDPLIDAHSSEHFEKILLNSPLRSHISHFASLNYRLSPHSSHPTSLSDPARNAKHPDHINDVLTALSFLQSNHGLRDDYILVGHSCGATLALQVAMSRHWSSIPSMRLFPPIGIVALEGLYDMPALVKYHGDMPAYEAFVTKAFGPEYVNDQGEKIDVWRSISPTAGNYDESWKEGRLVLLAHSHEDELVEWEQVELMRDLFVRQGWRVDGEGEGKQGRDLHMLELKGKHDQVWEEGVEAAKAIEKAISLLVKLDVEV